MAAESFPSRSTRFIPSIPASSHSKAAHQTMGKGKSHTHHGFFSFYNRVKNILPFFRSKNKKTPEPMGKHSHRFRGGNLKSYRTGRSDIYCS